MNSGATFFGRDRRLSGLRWCSPPPPQRSCLPPARVAAQERDMGACFSCIGGRVGPGAPGACRKRCGALCIGLSGCAGGGWSCLCRVSAAVSALGSGAPVPEPSRIGPTGRRGRERAPRGWGTRGVCCAWGQLKLKPATACAIRTCPDKSSRTSSVVRSRSIARRYATNFQ